MKNRLLTTTLILFTLFLFATQAKATVVNAQCMNAKGKMDACKIEDSAGAIKITYSAKSNSSLNKVIEGICHSR